MLVQNGDMIELDVSKKRIHLDVSDEGNWKKKKELEAATASGARGYANLYVKHVLQADKDRLRFFLFGKSGSLVTRDSHWLADLVSKR